MICMSMEKHKCKLCSKKFLSGKALGGHMRSHLIPLPLPPKTPPLNQDSGGRSESTLSLCSSENQEDKVNFNYGLRENPKKSFRMVDPEFLEDGYVVVQNRESESESEKNTTNRSRRSKRSRKIVANDERIEKEKEKITDFGSLSLFSDDADIAMCLMMLSRDSKSEPKYQCGVCYKMFKTSQALGSHKTIHKNKPTNKYDDEEYTQKISLKRKMKLVSHVDEKLHECPFCGKFFQSGQALGGHKRSHLVIMNSSNTTTTTATGSCSSTKLGDSLMEYSNAANLPNGFIDLNMPAPLEDLEDNDSAMEFQQEFI